ncbi:hypothetical protein ACRZ5S_22560 (plasmid) [Vibrio scophthalmi]|uniref:hypothetical protein n=1 Tax=Vibrio scophthalmi TaxID=45658 RepID=UPI003EC10606
MDHTKYWTSERTRKKQAALTRLSNGLSNEVLTNVATSELFDENELEAMRVAASALSRAKEKFKHLKEIKERIERQKQLELDRINKVCKRHAQLVFDEISTHPNLCNTELLLLWLAAAESTKSYASPECWEIDINDQVGAHFLGSDDIMRSRNASSMRSKALESFERFFRQVWRYSFETDSYQPIMTIELAVAELKGFPSKPRYSEIKKQYSRYINELESYNRTVIALERRKSIRSID